VKEGKSDPLKFREMKIVGMGITPVSYTTSGMPQADTPVIQKLAGKPGQWGLAYDHFKE